MDLQIPGYASLAEFAKEVGIPYMTARNHMLRGWCKWPRKIDDGITKDPAYKCWENMVQRCTNPKVSGGHNYIGRGISLYPPWRDFREFLSYIGPRPSLEYSIDRIDPDGDYVPGNVRWATPSQQANNKRSIERIYKIYRHGRKYRVSAEGRNMTFDTQWEALEYVSNL